MKKTRILGHSDIEVTAIGYGCMGQTHSYGVVEPEKEMVELMRYAYEVGYDGKTWTVSNYYKGGYEVPFGQLILVEEGIHWARPQHAQLVWDFLKHFRRNENGGIEQIQQ